MRYSVSINGSNHVIASKTKLGALKSVLGIDVLNEAEAALDRGEPLSITVEKITPKNAKKVVVAETTE